MNKFTPLLRSILLLALTLSLALPVRADDQPPPPDVSDLLIPDGPISVEIAPQLAQATGEVDIVVQLVDAPLAVADGINAKQQGGKLNAAQQRNYLRQLAQKQNGLMDQIRALNGRELARVSKALNAVIVAIDASRINAVAALPNIRSIRPVTNYELALGDVRPYMGATDVEAAGFDGTGVRVAVLDTGVDYTHKDLGGSGNVADYLAAYGTTISDTLNTTRDGLFPTQKVIAGHDFVGEFWPRPGVPGGGPLNPDDDPIDCGPGTIPAPCAGGHGTHTSDIIAGHSLDNSHKGIAPGASLVAVKVCSSVSTSCSGIALLEGMDFALDPNQDGNISDAVDIISMSLGSSYGQAQDDLSEASQNAVNLGVIVVAAAGNSADRPYIVSSPSTAPNVLSVAATFHPTAKLYLVTTAATSPKGAIWQSWSAAPVLTTGPLAYDTTNVNTKRGCSD